MESDPRIERTRQKLHQAITALVLTKSYDSISIRDIVAQAEIGYATFFRHYPDKEALLLDVLDELLGELKVLLRPSNGDLTAEGTLIFTHAAQNGPLYKVLLQGEGTQTILTKIQADGVTELLSHWANANNAVDEAQTAVPRPILANHIVSGIITLIKWWLDHDKPYPPAEMGRIYAKLFSMSKEQ